MKVTTNIRKTAAGATVAGAVGLGALGLLGTAVGQAAPNPGPPAPPVPTVPGNANSAWMPGMPPGQNPFGPPGQVMKMPMLDVAGVGQVANPFYNVPPGHWGDVTYLNPQHLTWLPPGYPDLTTPLNLTWNAAAGAWGVFVDGTFVPYPIRLPAPAGS